MHFPAIYLASQSPRRQALLQQIGVDFTVLRTEIDETPFPAEPPQTYVLRMAKTKALAGIHDIGQHGYPLRPVLAADTSVILEQQILGKPASRAAARNMLSALSGRSHQVMTAVALATPAQCRTALSISTVTFMPLTDEQIESYIDSGEPADKAGAYGIQGLGGQFVIALNGSYSGVMGLPLYETAGLLRAIM